MAKKPVPLIGLTTYSRPAQFGDDQVELNGLTFPYIDAIRLAGGIPLLIPHGAEETELRSLVGRLDGLILPGGEDVDPREYGKVEIPECGRIDRRRDRLELSLARIAIEKQLPMLAICRGHQVLNVALSGTLWQDLSTQLPESQPHSCFHLEKQNLLAHEVELVAGSLLHAIFGVERIGTNSSHHQAIRELAPGLVITGRAPDGVVEAVEMPAHPFALGLQWHPERMVLDHPRMLRPFEALVQAASS
jgi:putative glutamine amidotransferase